MDYRHHILFSPAIVVNIVLQKSPRTESLTFSNPSMVFGQLKDGNFNYINLFFVVSCYKGEPNVIQDR